MLFRMLYMWLVFFIDVNRGFSRNRLLYSNQIDTSKEGGDGYVAKQGYSSTLFD